MSRFYDRQNIPLTQYRGWMLPIGYRSVEEEFGAIARGAGLLETPFIGLLEVRGKDRLDFLHRISTNDLLNLPGGAVRGTLFLTDKARLVDLAYCAVDEDSLTLLCSAEREAAIRELTERYTILEDVSVRSLTPERVVISIAGPGSVGFGGIIAGAPLLPNSCIRRPFGFGSALVIAATTSRWQMLHFVVERDVAERAWEWLVEEGSRRGVRAAGAGAFDLYRITTGMPLAGAEITPDHNPYDAGLLEFVSFTKGCYIGQEVVARIDTYGKRKRTLAGILLEDPAAIGTPPLTVIHQGLDAGVLTSVAATSVRGKYPALGILPLDLTGSGVDVEIEGRGNRVSARVQELPVVLE